MKFVERIEDSKLWKDQFEDSLKGRSKMQGNYYVVNKQSGRGETTQYIPQVAADVIMAKAKLKRKYKRKPKRLKRHSNAKQARSRKVKRKKPCKRRKTKKRKKTKRK